MILTVADHGLEVLLASAALLAQRWPTAAEDVMVILGAILLAGATLADVMRNGLIRVLAPVPGAPFQLSLACGQAVLTASAAGPHGEPVADPHLRPSEVCRLAVTGIAVSGSSVLEPAAG